MTEPQRMGTAIGRNGLFLGLFAIVAVGLVAAVHLQTRDNIAAQERAARERALLEIIPRDQHDNQMLDDSRLVDDFQWLQLREPQPLFHARRDNEVVAVIIPALARDGYSGDIQLIVGIWRDGSIAGVRVLSHRETPGLGDYVDTRRSDWVLSFNGRSLGNPPPEQWKVKKEQGVFDEFTGATITPRAVIAAVYRVLSYFEAHQATLLNPRPRPEESPDDD